MSDMGDFMAAAEAGGGTVRVRGGLSVFRKAKMLALEDGRAVGGPYRPGDGSLHRGGPRNRLCIRRRGAKVMLEPLYEYWLLSTLWLAMICTAWCVYGALR